MKRCILIMVCIAMIFCLVSCGGSIDGMKTYEVQSEIYTQEDIRDAIDVVTKEFSRSWTGCTMTELYYAGDKLSKNSQEDAAIYNADELIVLISSFEVDDSGGPYGTMNPNSTYSEWLWILVRNDGGKWKRVDGGY